jgi:hypothetical protein
MSGHLPVDPELRDQLARRSAGRRPADLIAEISAALDTTPVERPRRFASRPGLGAWRTPRAISAVFGLALVVVIAVALLAVPARQSGPSTSLAGYPADRALTTAELARVMAGPALPVNTTLVATVTIDARTDVCPMNRYPTIGVVEGMDSQVCVMAGGVSGYLKSDKVGGTFAFRFLAPGVLGSLGEVTPASSSRLAFSAGAEWPAGKTFLVDAWLGGSDWVCPSPGASVSAGDPLNPTGADPCRHEWLVDDPFVYPSASYAMPASPVGARLVGAAGMRIIDSVSDLNPVRGVYVVRADGEAWVVMARLADISLPQATATPTATATPASTYSGYPTDRALTTAELSGIMAGPALTGNPALVASVTIAPADAGCLLNGYATLGMIEGMGGQRVCLDDDLGKFRPYDAPASGTFAFRYVDPSHLDLLGAIAPASSSRLAFHVADNWPATEAFLVDGWLETMLIAGSCPTPGVQGQPSPSGACTYLDLLSDDRTAPIDVVPSGPAATIDTLGLHGKARLVQASAIRDTESIIPSAQVHGVWVVSRSTGPCPGEPPQSSVGCPIWGVVADVAVFATAQASPAEVALGPTASPTTEPPATPMPASAVPAALPTGAPGAAPLGLLTSGNRPLTEAEFAELWREDPSHLAGRIVIVKGAVPTGFECGAAELGDASLSPPPCHIAILDGQIAQDGHYWAVRVGPDGKLSVVGEVSMPAESFVFSVEQLDVSTSLNKDDLAVVEGWLVESMPTCDSGATPLPAGCGPYSTLGSMATDNSPFLYGVQQGAYQQVTGASGTGSAVYGLFLVRVTNQNGGTLLARLEPVTP